MRRGRQLVLRPLLAALLGVVAATLVIGATLLLLQVSPESDEPWGELGQIFLGVLLAGVVGVVVWVAGLARAARHLFAPGRRLGVVLWSTFAILTPPWRSASPGVQWTPTASGTRSGGVSWAAGSF